MALALDPAKEISSVTTPACPDPASSPAAHRSVADVLPDLFWGQFQNVPGWEGWAVQLFQIQNLTTFSFDKIVMYDELARLKHLADDWDGYGAAPIDKSVIELANRFIFLYESKILRTPAVVPMTRGRLQFEWHRDSRSLEIEFEDPRSVHYLKWDSGRGVEEEDIISVSDRPTIIGLLDWFFSEEEDVEPAGARSPS
jgi:hypothetical protein